VSERKWLDGIIKDIGRGARKKRKKVDKGTTNNKSREHSCDIPVT
jgi:hypothetical protein